MPTVDLIEALTLEHRDIDEGIEAFVADLDRGIINAEPLLTAFAALRRHIYLEEELLFPPIREAGLMMPILVMLREHAELWRLMDELVELLDDSDKEQADDHVAAACRNLLGQLDQHNSKEEPIIYPHAHIDLSEEAAAELAAFLSSGTMPDDWVCQAAA